MFEELSDFANLPLLALVSVVLSFVLMPALNAFSRFNERQADRYAFESIASVDPFISSMNKLAEQNLAERTPSKWVEWFFHSHPSISRRLAAAEAWSKISKRNSTRMIWNGIKHSLFVCMLAAVASCAAFGQNTPPCANCDAVEQEPVTVQDFREHLLCGYSWIEFYSDHVFERATF